MSRDQSLGLLNRLLAIQYRSMPMYLSEAKLWVHPGDEKATATLQHIVTDQKAMVSRIADVVLARRGSVNMGGFPMDFTDTHDLAFDGLLKRVLEYQLLDIAAIEQLIARIPKSDREALELAQEALGSERAHLEALQELAIQAV